MDNAANATNATDATDEPSDEESRIFEAAVNEIRHQRHDACRLDGMRRNVQTTDKVWAMSLWDDDLVYGEDVRQCGACAGAAYLLQKHVMAHSDSNPVNLCIMDTSGVLPNGAATAPQGERIFTFRVTYNGLSSVGTGRGRREAREMAALQMLRILYPGTWTYGQLHDALIPPFVPPAAEAPAVGARKSRRLDRLERVERPAAPSWAYR